MKISFEIKNVENIPNFSHKELEQVQEIFVALVTSGGLTGVKGGQTIIHFDPEGMFKKIELKYFPWIKRKNI